MIYSHLADKLYTRGTDSPSFLPPKNGNLGELWELKLANEKKPVTKTLSCSLKESLRDKYFLVDDAFPQIFLADFQLGEFGLEKASKNGVKNG